MFYYPHHIGDYRSATAHLSNEEDLAYRRLLDMYYDTEQPIPLDTQWVARRIRVGVEVVELVLADFFGKTGEGWRSVRCDKEIAAYHAKAEIARANGKKGGRKKTAQEPTGNPVGSRPEPDGNPDATGSKPNQEPRTKNRKPSVPNGTVTPAAEVEGLDQQAWSRWIDYRKSTGRTLKPASIPAAQKAMAAFGDSQVAVVEQSVANGWQGLFALKPGAQARTSAHTNFSTKNYSEGINDDGTFD
jgi:uncharacterized protein YdaU (DUF1376 family)